MSDQPDQSEKTEEPTEKKLADARKKGDVVKSQEVNSWFVMLGTTLVVLIFSHNMVRSLAVQLKGVIEHAHDIPLDNLGIQNLFSSIGITVAIALGLPFLVLMLAAVAGNIVQHGLLFTLEPIKPKFSKVSPLAGFKRLFSMQSLFNFGKSMLKLAVVGIVITVIIYPQRDVLDALMVLDPANLLSVTHSMSVKLLIGVLSVLTILAALDYAYQRYIWQQKQKMTMKEVRDEYKQMEGDPQVRAKLRQIRIERGRKRMMAAVPKASVVITNPTHYAVALQYESGMDAPICLAKGIDAVALRIRSVAEENDIPLVENPPLARALHASVEIEEEIPVEHYKAVAEVIGYVTRLRQQGASSSN